MFVVISSGCTLNTTRPSDLLTATPQPPVELTVLQTELPPTLTATSLPTQTITPTATLPGIGPDNFTSAINPLTGLTVEDPSLLERRPVAFKINNYPRNNRPQWGLSLADIVYEYYHNNDLPRFHAIFYGQQADLVGPIRSGRFFDDYLVEMYQSIFVFARADSRVMERFEEADYVDRLIYFLDGECPPDPVCRLDPKTRNLLVSDTYAPGPYIQQTGGDDRRPDLQGMWFYDQVPSNGSPVSEFYLRYSYGAYLYWQYDLATGRYLRYQDTQDDIGGRGQEYELLTDQLTDQPISAANVVVLLVPHFYFYYVPPASGSPAVEVVDMELRGRGPAIVFRDGYAYPVEWVWNDPDTMLYLVTPAGNRFPLKPGNTWFQVVTDQVELEIDENIWRMTFIWQ